MATLRATAAGAYVEQNPPNRLRTTTAGAYVEQNPPNRLRTTTAGAYVEQRPQAKVKTTAAGAYVELSVGEVYNLTAVGDDYVSGIAELWRVLSFLTAVGDGYLSGAAEPWRVTFLTITGDNYVSGIAEPYLVSGMWATGFNYMYGMAILTHIPFWQPKLGEFYLPAPDRDGITVQATRLGSAKRMSDGRLRTDVIALKANITLRWSLLSAAERALIAAAWQTATTAPQSLKLPDQRTFAAVLAAADLEENQVWDARNTPWYNVVLRLEEV